MQAILNMAADDGRSIPRGSHGGRLHVRYCLVEDRAPVPNAQVTESFRVTTDPYDVGGSIRTGTYRTDRRGFFDDYIGFSTRQELPDDFRLVADQEIRANGEVVARNRVQWSATNVSVIATDGRRPRQVAARVTLH